jgi:hypothetical protein
MVFYVRQMRDLLLLTVRSVSYGAVEILIRRACIT